MNGFTDEIKDLPLSICDVNLKLVITLNRTIFADQMFFLISPRRLQSFVSGFFYRLTYQARALTYSTQNLGDQHYSF